MDLAVRIAQLVIAFGVLVALIGLRQAQRQRIRASEGFYVRRYWKIMDRLSLDALKGHRHLVLRDDDEQAIRAFLLLCEDELDERADGWITDAAWSIWQRGMLYQLSRWPFAEVWAEVQRETAQPTGSTTKPAFERLRGLSEENADPYQPHGRLRSFVQPRSRGLCGLRRGR